MNITNDNVFDMSTLLYENEILDEESEPEENEPEDSVLKEIYSGQTFTTFDILEQSLKRYAIQLGFEIRTVRAEKDGGTWSQKIYKCHHSGKYIPKKI